MKNRKLKIVIAFLLSIALTALTSYGVFLTEREIGTVKLLSYLIYGGIGISFSNAFIWYLRKTLK